MRCYFTSWMQSLREGGNYVSEIRNLAMVEGHIPLSEVTDLVLIYA
jgi:hypothetical protein